MTMASAHVYKHKLLNKNILKNITHIDDKHLELIKLSLDNV